MNPCGSILPIFVDILGGYIKIDRIIRRRAYDGIHLGMLVRLANQFYKKLGTISQAKSNFDADTDPENYHAY